MTQIQSKNDFDELIDIVIPLIMNYAELNFDLLLSSWMGELIYKQYVSWKNSSAGAKGFCKNYVTLRVCMYVSQTVTVRYDLALRCLTRVGMYV